MIELLRDGATSGLMRQVCSRPSGNKTTLLATFVPPVAKAAQGGDPEQRVPGSVSQPAALKEMWFVIDCSGSMAGEAIEQACNAALFFIKDMPLGAGG